MNPSVGLLGVRAQWTLPLGVSQAAPVRAAARVLLPAMVFILACWLTALVVDARAGQGSWGQVWLALLYGVGWLLVAVRPAWRALDQRASVTLAWGGLPARDPSRQDPQATPGWSVTQWQRPVAVHVVFDLGAWVLLKVASKDRSAKARYAWGWLHAEACFQGQAGHHWRALLFNRHANAVGDVEAAMDGDVTAVVASWARMQRRWSNLTSSFQHTGGRTARRTAMSGGDFADTVSLARQPGHLSRPGKGKALP